mgnify:CR=1 FL=1
MTHVLHRIGLRTHRAVMRPFHSRPRLIVLFSTMRSGTTLLTRILADNPEIAGFGEAHIRYSDPDSLLDLKYWIARFTRRYPGRDLYLLDKVLHGKHVPDLGRLAGMAELHPIFLIRAPLSNARSLGRMFDGTGEAAELPWDYLLKRYDELERHLDGLQGAQPIAALSYERLTETPDSVLAELGDHLGLSQPLNARYQTPAYLGRWGIGDGSDTIRSGAIQPAAPPPDAAAGEDEVPPAVRQAYDRLSDHLRGVAARTWL